MTLLLPSLQAERIRASIVDYLSTTFALTDAQPRRALAADQASRLAHLLAADPILAGVRAAVYTGDSTGWANQSSKRMSTDPLIADRHHIRHNPPDILLTNYKMLDQLLLRPKDQELWATSATSPPPLLRADGE